MLQAARWYEDQSAGLGFRLFNKVYVAVDEIPSWPDTAPPVPGWDKQPTLRSKRLQTFPYRVIYYVTDTQIVVVAYAHTRREASYWQHRIGLT